MSRMKHSLAGCWDETAGAHWGRRTYSEPPAPARTHLFRRVEFVSLMCANNCGEILRKGGGPHHLDVAVATSTPRVFRHVGSSTERSPRGEFRLDADQR